MKTAAKESRYIFISYSRQNKVVVSALRARLQASGFSVWMDEDMLVGSDIWRKRIVEGMFNATAIILCLSPAVHNKDAFVYKEILLALEIEKCRGAGCVRIIPVCVQPCRIPDLLESRHCVHYMPTMDGAEVIRAVSGAVASSGTERESASPLRSACEQYLEHLMELDKSSFVKQGEWISTCIIGMLVLEIGLLQEWAPPTQHGSGFPGWRDPASFRAVGASIGAAIAAMGMNLGYYRLARRYSEELSRRKEMFYLVSSLVLVIGLGAVFFLLLPTMQAVTVGGALQRNGAIQVSKALFVLGLQLLVLLWPSWFLCVWEFRGMNYDKPALLAIPSRQIVTFSLIAVLGLGALQWMALKTLQQVGVNDLWVAVHVMVQAVLMVLLAWNAWWFRATAERLETRRDEIKSKTE